MAHKCKTSAGDVSTAKKQKSLSAKVELLDWLSRGHSVASVGRLCGVNKSTVRDIQNNEKVIQERVAESAVPSTKVVTHVRDVH